MTRQEMGQPDATSGSFNLAALLQAIPPGRRRVVLQTALSFGLRAIPDNSSAIGPIRVAFAGHWETRYGQPIPVERLRALMKPPLPIATVIECNKLMLMRDGAEIRSAIDQLLDFLNARLDDVGHPGEDLPNSASVAQGHTEL